MQVERNQAVADFRSGKTQVRLWVLSVGCLFWYGYNQLLKDIVMSLLMSSLWVVRKASLLKGRALIFYSRCVSPIVHSPSSCVHSSSLVCHVGCKSEIGFAIF